MDDKKRIVSKLITSASNFSVQYNFQAIAVALLVMIETVYTSNDEECKDGNQAEWVQGTSDTIVLISFLIGFILSLVFI